MKSTRQPHAACLHHRRSRARAARWPTRAPAYKRILLKLSGEALMGEIAYGINRATIERIVAEVGEVVRLGVQVAVVIGGGNIFRGVAPGAAGMDRATADYMGMLATVMNALALPDAMRHAGIAVARAVGDRASSRWSSPTSAARRCSTWKKARSSIFAAGTGNPFFTTDTAAALRGARSAPRSCSRRPRSTASIRPIRRRTRGARATRRISFDEAIVKNLQVMDATAFALCRDQNCRSRCSPSSSPAR